MTAPNDQHKREALETILAAAAGDATEEQLARLSQFVVEDAELREFVVEALSQEAWLTWHGTHMRPERMLEEITLLPFEIGDATANGPRAAVVDPSVAVRSTQRSAAARRYRFAPALSAAILLAIGALSGSWMTRQLMRDGDEVVLGIDARHANGSAEDSSVQSASPFAARLISGTACVWSPDVSRPTLKDGRLRRGESLNLMEGLAELKLDLDGGGSATLQIEGPARMVITAEGTPSLNLGKLSATVEGSDGRFVLETPFGQVSVREDSALGVAVYGSEVEVHVFRGAVEVVSPWTSDESAVESYAARKGESLRLSVANSEAMQVARGNAQPAYFTSQLSMSSDRLEITDEYVNEVRRAAPIVYWRFEGAPDGIIRNEMGDRFNGHVVGSPAWAPQGHNRAIEFGSGITNEVLQAYVESNDSLDGQISDSYTTEVWVKPSHYHLGALVSFVENSTDDSQLGLHGLLLELGGPLTTPSTIEHPGRIRFLHRDPPSDDAATGTSCFSQVPYELRKWSQVVAVKDGAEMRLYVNGKLVAQGDENTKLAGGLTLLVGQLDRYRDWRRFNGQIDELAIYSRALSDREILRHYSLIRPSRPSRDEI